MPQMAEKTEPDAPPNCAVLPLSKRARHARVFGAGMAGLCESANLRLILLGERLQNLAHRRSDLFVGQRAVAARGR